MISDNNKFFIGENTVRYKLSKYRNRHMNDIISLETNNLSLNRQKHGRHITDFRAPNETANQMKFKQILQVERR